MAILQLRTSPPPDGLPPLAVKAASRPGALRSPAALALLALLAFAAGLFTAATSSGGFAPGALLGLGLWLAGALLGWCAARLSLHTPPAPQPDTAPASTPDPLTGADGFDRLQDDLERPLGSGARGLVAVLDIDGFRPLCAELGVPAGQRVLLGLAELLDQRLRRIDGFYRIGDDTFVLRLPGLRLEEAAPRLFALHAEVITCLSRLPGRATLSIGAAHAEPDEDGGSWLARAQAALHEARAEGPSRILIDGGARHPRIETTRLRAANPQFLPPSR